MRITSTIAALALAVLVAGSSSGAPSVGTARSSTLIVPEPTPAPECIVYVNGADVTVTSDVTTVLAANATACGALVQNVGALSGARCRFLSDAAPTATAGIVLQAGATLDLGREAAAGLRCIREGTDNQTLSPTYKYYETLP